MFFVKKQKLNRDISLILLHQ